MRYLDLLNHANTKREEVISMADEEMIDGGEVEGTPEVPEEAGVETPEVAPEEGEIEVAPEEGGIEEAPAEGEVEAPEAPVEEGEVQSEGQF